MFAGLASTHANAGDGALAGVLVRNGCVEAKVTKVYRAASTSVFQANCGGTSHRIIEVECGTAGCRLLLRGDTYGEAE
ncbi:hypothetical protein J8I29_04375 [Labrys sp. LIt4]|uniref:hypothetical protein n=1 Tax=Labrys sp. LIt4 TaxID=2821355 RepID=UPI001AE02B48|nr:hypothetical protein [Labrys sp. LIt4]MBP0578538.1 hypothetical protein [Labrys sp. LIt4]